MKLVSKIALVTTLTLGMLQNAAAQNSVHQDNINAGMEEMVVTATRLPAEMEEVLVTASRLPEMEEILVVASRLPRPDAEHDFLATVAMGDFGQMALRRPSL